MAGCQFDGQNYVGTACSGYDVVVNGSFVICTPSTAPSGGCVPCTDATLGLNNFSIFKSRCDAENVFNKAENCTGGTCAGVADGSGCWLSNGGQGCCQAGQCVATSGGGGSGSCAQGSFFILGTCVSQGALLLLGGAALLLLRKR
jgi:hypothetical protein